MAAKINAGAKILDGLRDALSGNFASVTIEGQRWVRSDEIERITAERDVATREREIAREARYAAEDRVSSITAERDGLRKALHEVADFMQLDITSGDDGLWTPDYQALHDTVTSALSDADRQGGGNG